MQHTGLAFNPCYLKYEKEKERRVLSMSLLGETRRNQRREKREPTRETHTLLFTAVVVSFFVLLLFVRRLT